MSVEVMSDQTKEVCASDEPKSSIDDVLKLIEEALHPHCRDFIRTKEGWKLGYKEQTT